MICPACTNRAAYCSCPEVEHDEVTLLRQVIRASGEFTLDPADNNLEGIVTCLTEALRQYDETAAAPPAHDRRRPLLLGLLGVDGVLSALMAVFFLPAHLGSVWFPISALLSGVLNAALVWAALQTASSPTWAALPLWTWVATVGLLTLGGPGDDIVFGGVGFMEYGVLLLLALGVLPGAWLLVRRRLPPR